MKPQFGSRPHPKSRETHRGAGTVRRATSAPPIFRRAFPLPLLSRELRNYDPQGAKLPPLWRYNMAVPTSIRSLDSHVVPPRCTQGLSLRCRKRSTPSRGKRFLQTAAARNSDALTVQLPPMPSAPPQQDYPLSRRASLQYVAPTPIRAYYSPPIRAPRIAYCSANPKSPINAFSFLFAMQLTV